MRAATDDCSFFIGPGVYDKLSYATWKKKWSAKRASCSRFYTALHLWPRVQNYFTRHITLHTSARRLCQTQIYHLIPPSSHRASFLTTSQCCTSTSVGEWDPARGETPPIDPKRAQPHSSWRAETCLLFMKTSFTENPLAHWGGKRTLRGGKVFF